MWMLSEILQWTLLLTCWVTLGNKLYSLSLCLFHLLLLVLFRVQSPESSDSLEDICVIRPSCFYHYVNWSFHNSAILTTWTAKPTRSNQPLVQPIDSSAHKSAVVHLSLPTKHGTLSLDFQKNFHSGSTAWGLAVLFPHRDGRERSCSRSIWRSLHFFSSISNQFLKCGPPIILPCAAYRRRRNNFTPGGRVMKNLSAVWRVEADRIGFLSNVSKFWLLLFLIPPRLAYNFHKHYPTQLAKVSALDNPITKTSLYSGLFQNCQSILIWEKLNKWSEMGTTYLDFLKKIQKPFQKICLTTVWQHQSLYSSDFKDRRGRKVTSVLGKKVFVGVGGGGGGGRKGKLWLLGFKWFWFFPFPVLSVQ